MESQYQSVLERARRYAGGKAAGPEHLWLGVLDSPYGSAILAPLGLSVTQVAQNVAPGTEPGEWTPLAEEVLEAASRAPLVTSPPEAHFSPETLPVEPCHLAYALVRTSARPVERLMQMVGIVPSRLRWLVAGSDPRFPHPRDVGENRRMSWAAAASEEAARLGWELVGPEQLLLGLLADPTNSACRALVAGGLDLSELRRRLEVPGPGSRVEEMTFTPEVLEALKRAAEAWGDLDPDSACTLQALLQVSDVLGSAQAAVEAVLPQILHGNLERSQAVTIGGVAVGMSPEQVLALRGEPGQRTPEEGQETWTFDEVGVLVKQGRVVGVHGPTLEQQGRVVLRAGDAWQMAERVLGVRRQVSFAGDPPVKIWTLITSGTVGFLMLECLSHA